MTKTCYIVKDERDEQLLWYGFARDEREAINRYQEAAEMAYGEAESVSFARVHEMPLHEAEYLFSLLFGGYPEDSDPEDPAGVLCCPY